MAQLRCARCGADWAPGYSQCWNCGYDRAVFRPVSDQLSCATCRSPLNPDDRFCAQCGTPVPAWPTPLAPRYLPDEPTRRRRRFGVREIGLILVALAVLVASVYSVRPAPNRNHTVTGTLTLFQSGLIKDGEFCLGAGEYIDLAPGSRVTVRDENDDTIAIGRLDRSTWLGPEACRFWFVIQGVPNASVYTFEVSDRERIEYTRDQLEDANWRVFMTTGDPALL